MYFSPSFIAAAALYLVPFAHADISRPNFTPTKLTAPFLEQFTDDWTSRWQPSHAKKVNDKSTEEEWAYVGQWSVEEPTVLKGINGDKGLVLKDKAAHHAISAKFPTAIDNTGKTLVVQYEVKLQDGLECGGAYMKLLRDNAALQSEEFSNAAPYVIMFGPDKCGATNKVHFIFQHKNPITGAYEEKHLKDTPLISTGTTTALYTLIIRPDQTFEIMIDGASSRNGSLLESFAPAVNPDSEIDDPNDTKPSDWVDTAKIADPEASKPADWNEEEPYEIEDVDAVKPVEWLEDEPTMIPDPEAEKPEDWDEEEDGDWVGPMVPNPACIDAGCGPWERPMIKNPAYKGKWTAPFIDNPLYKGLWKAARIINPSYFEDKTPANLEPIGAIGFEIWTMQNNILFDNIYIGHSEDDARKLKEETFDVKIALEKEEEAATAPPPPPETPKSPSDLKFADDPVLYVREKVQLFLTIAKKDPLEAARFVPEVAAGAGVLAVTILTLLASLLFGGSSAPKVQTKPVVKQSAVKVPTTQVVTDDLSAKEQVAEALATGAENVAADMNKRTTRSSGAPIS